MASVLDLVKHYQHAIEKYPNDEHKILKCIDKLFNLKVTVQHLQETGVGRTVNALRKEPGDVGQASRALVNKWKLMVASEESDSETDNNDTANHNGYGNGKDSDENSKQSIQPKEEQNNRRSTSSNHEERNSYREMNGKHSGSKRRHQSSEDEEPDVKKSKSSSDRHDRDSYNKSNVKVKPEPKSESESEDDSDHSHSDSSESDMSESTVEEVKVKQEIKTEQEQSKSSKHSSRNEDHKKESSSKHSHESKSSKSSKHSPSVSKERHSSEKSSSKENSHNSHKSTKEKESSSEKKHKTDQKEKDKKHKEESKSSKPSSSERHKSSSTIDSSSDKHKSSSQTDGSSDKHKSHSEKHSSKTEKHRSSSQNKSDKDKHKSSSEKEISTDKHKSKDRNSSKEKHSSSSKEKSKDRSSSSKEKSDSHKSDKKHSSSSEKLKSNDKNKEKVDDKSDSRSKHKSSSSSHKSSKSTTNESTDDIPKKIKQVSHSEDSNDGIDCGSGASFAEALGMISPAKPKKKSTPLKDSCSPGTTDLSPAALLAPHARLAPLPALEISALPEISPHYKPRPPPKLLPHFTDEEAMSSIISSKNQRTKVYSGNKVFGKIPSLYEMCVQILQEHIDALEYTGGVPYEILKPVIDKATPQQLFLLEHYNPYLMEDTDHLWQKFCEKHFRKQQRQEMETWREMYMRCQEEQEHKLKSLTENIKIAQEAKKAPIKQTKMAYVDTVVKPPRNIARKQALHGTAHAASASPAARVASLAAAPNVLRGSVRPSPSAPTAPSAAFKPKRAPLMAKALQFMRGRKR